MNKVSLISLILLLIVACTQLDNTIIDKEEPIKTEKIMIVDTVLMALPEEYKAVIVERFNCGDYTYSRVLSKGTLQYSKKAKFINFTPFEYAENIHNMWKLKEGDKVECRFLLYWEGDARLMRILED